MLIVFVDLMLNEPGDTKLYCRYLVPEMLVNGIDENGPGAGFNGMARVTVP